MLSSLGSTEIIIIGLVLVILFGSSRLSDLAKSLGETQKELKKTKKEYENIAKSVDSDETENEKKEVGSK